MREIDEKREELIRLRQKASYWKEQCARFEENEPALIKRSKELEAQLRERQEELDELQALEAELKRCEQLLEMLSEEQAPRRDSSDSAERGDATEEGLGATSPSE